MLVSARQLERDAAEATEFLAIIERIRAAFDAGGEPLPRVCDDADLVTALEGVIAGPSQNATSARFLRSELRTYCEPFLRGDPAFERRRATQIAGYLETVDRIDGWMHDILHCIDPGPYNFTCENAFGPDVPEYAEEARRMLGMTAGARRAFEGVVGARRPMPCHDALWKRIELYAWKGSVTRAQASSLVSHVTRMCNDAGLADERRARSRAAFGASLDREESFSRARSRQSQAAFAQLQAAIARLPIDPQASH